MTVRAIATKPGSVGRRILELAVWLTASALIAIMVAIGGSAVQVTSATPLPAGAITPGSATGPAFAPESEKILRLATPTPDPMIWCRPLSGSTICIRERS